MRPHARGGGHPSGTAVAGSLVRSTREHRAGRPRSLAQGAAGSPLDLAPGGVYRAAAVTCGAGGLLHHRFTLAPALAPGRSVFCGTVPRVTPGRRYRPPCPVEPGPSSPGLRPARPPGRLTRAQDTPTQPVRSSEPKRRRRTTPATPVPGPARVACRAPGRRAVVLHWGEGQPADDDSAGTSHAGAIWAERTTVHARTGLTRVDPVYLAETGGVVVVSDRAGIPAPVAAEPAPVRGPRRAGRAGGPAPRPDERPAAPRRARDALS